MYSNSQSVLTQLHTQNEPRGPEKFHWPVKCPLLLCNLCSNRFMQCMENWCVQGSGPSDIVTWSAGSVPVPRVSKVFVMSRYSAKMWYFTFWHFCIFLCHRQFLFSFEYKCHASSKDYKYLRTCFLLYICLAQRMLCWDSFFHSWMEIGIQNWHKWNKTKTEDTAQANLKITLFSQNPEHWKRRIKRNHSSQ